MRKIPTGAPAPVSIFVDNLDLKICVVEDHGKITGFTVTHRKRKQQKFFVVVDDNILAAWKKVEKFTADL
jgi:hypothetical protein